jgi:hypothetical protein
LDDAAWSAAAWTSDFVDIAGNDRPPLPVRTRAKLLWDEHHLYVAAELEEDDVRATLRDRDRALHREGAIELFLDPDDDGRDYLELQVNALGTVCDLLLDKPYRAGGHADEAFTLEGMRVAVHVDGTINDPSDRDRRWTVEVAIPFESLRKLAPTLPPRPGTRWRMNLARSPGRRDRRFATWSPQGEVNMHLPERWGWLVFTAPSTRP